MALEPAVPAPQLPVPHWMIMARPPKADAPTEVLTRVGDRVLTLSNLGKVLFPATGYTKAEVISYYSRIAPVLVPHIADRVVTRLRFPDGVGEGAFPSMRRTLRWVRPTGSAGSRSAPVTA